ncbi:MAG: CbiQ family ECF transporter T component, partial [Thiobacillus sp.]
MTLHSAARILLWCGWVVGVEVVSLSILSMLAVVSATAFVFARFRYGAWRLLRRSRWLMLILLLTYAYTLPGDPVWAAWGAWSPTLQGVRAGAVRVLQLSLMLIALAVLLASTPRDRLIYGLYELARPLAFLGFDRRAFAVRLGLTLEYIEQHASSKDVSLSQWLAKLTQPEIYHDSAVYRLDRKSV